MLRYLLIIALSAILAYGALVLIEPDNPGPDASGAIIWLLLMLVILGVLVFVDIYLWGHKSVLKIKNLKLWGLLFWLYLLIMIFFAQSI